MKPYFGLFYIYFCAELSFVSCSLLRQECSNFLSKVEDYSNRVEAASSEAELRNILDSRKKMLFEHSSVIFSSFRNAIHVFRIRQFKADPTEPDQRDPVVERRGESGSV